MIEKFSPCKINLMLAILGVRPDGFHELISIVAPTKFGDTLKAQISYKPADTLTCNMEGIPLDSSNLVIKAAELFREATGRNEHFDFDLQKRVPAGAGLGGGSSNGAAALLAVNELCGNPLPTKKLSEIAAQMGSDCPLFLTNTPVVMRGRGERIFALRGEAREYIERLKLVIFKPDFSINTGWAYSQMKANPQDYMSENAAESALSEWLENPSISGLPLINNMQIEAFKKFPALQIVLDEIRTRFRVPAMMSGSGSACFAIVNNLEDDEIAELEKLVKNLLGETALVVRA